MAASTNDLFKKTGAGTVTTLAAPGKALSATSITVGATTNHPTDTGIVIAIRQVDSAGELVAGTYTEWSATVTSGTSFAINAVPVYGSDQVYAAGSTTQVYIPLSAYAHNELIDGILTEHNQDGSHSDVTAESLAVSGTTSLTGALTVKSYDGWINTADTWTYASSTTFTIAGVDRTAQFPVGTKIKLTQTTEKFFYVTAKAFATDTTITINGGSDYSLANAAITSPALSYDATPQGFPAYFNFTPSYNNLTIGNATNQGKLAMQGKITKVWTRLVYGSTSSISGNVSQVLPVTAESPFSTSFNHIGLGHIEDSGTTNMLVRVRQTSTTAATIDISGASATYTTASSVSMTSTLPMTWANGDTLALTYEYIAA